MIEEKCENCKYDDNHCCAICGECNMYLSKFTPKEELVRKDEREKIFKDLLENHRMMLDTGAFNLNVKNGDTQSALDCFTDYIENFIESY